MLHLRRFRRNRLDRRRSAEDRLLDHLREENKMKEGKTADEQPEDDPDDKKTFNHEAP